MMFNMFVNLFRISEGLGYIRGPFEFWSVNNLALSNKKKFKWTEAKKKFYLRVHFLFKSLKCSRFDITTDSCRLCDKFDTLIWK